MASGVIIWLRTSSNWGCASKGCEIEGGSAKPETGGKAAKPGAAADALAKVGDQLDIFGPVAQAGAPVARIGRRSGALADGVRQPEGCGRAALLRTELATMKHV
jgi:hypothetical protein